VNGKRTLTSRTTTNEAGTIGQGEVLLQLGVVAAQLLRELRELAHPRAPVAIAVLPEREDILDSEPSVLAGLREREALLVEEPNEVLAGYIEKVGGLLGGQLLPTGTTVIESPRAITSATRSST
jgi:hypothetical protein